MRKIIFTIALANILFLSITNSKAEITYPRIHSSTEGFETVQKDTKTDNETRVITYLPYYSISSVTKQIFKHLTHVNYFALGMNTAGELGRVTSSGGFTFLSEIPQVANDLDTLKGWRGNRTTKIFVVFGGWVQSDYFDEVVASDAARANFIKNVKEFLLTHGVDGADIDWEGYHGAVNDVGYKKLLLEMKQAFDGTGLGLSVAIGKTHTSLAGEFMDVGVEHIGLMTYGKVFGDGMQVSLEQLQGYVNNWIDAGATKEKLVVGVPFYGRTPADGTSVKYRDIIAQYNPGNSVNSVVHNNKTYYYNGVDAIKTKVNYVLDAGLKGIMIWEQGQDMSLDNPKSLLQAITDIIPVNLSTSINTEIPYFPEEDNLGLQVFPCPVSDELSVSVNTESNSKLTLLLFDIYGREMKRIQSEYPIAGKHTFSLSIASLSNGVYLLRVNCNGKGKSVKIIKQ